MVILENGASCVYVDIRRIFAIDFVYFLVVLFALKRTIAELVHFDRSLNLIPSDLRLVCWY